VFEDTIACSAPDNGTQGAGYVFERSTYGDWPEVFKYTNSWAAHLGDSVSVGDDLIAWGAPRTNNYRGSVFVIEHNTTWAHYQELIPAAATYGNHFGGSVALQDHTLLAGATGYEEFPATWADTGAVFRFEDDAVSFTEVETITPPAAQHRIWFGNAVALTCGQAVIAGKGWEAGGQPRAGGVWFYE